MSISRQDETTVSQMSARGIGGGGKPAPKRAPTPRRRGVLVHPVTGRASSELLQRTDRPY